MLAQDLPLSYIDQVIGAAVFDLSGLPKEYFTTDESKSVGWVQTIFQALGLRSLLISSLKLEGFQYVMIHSEAHHAVVVKQGDRYTAFLVNSTIQDISQDFVRWAQEFEPEELRSNQRFQLS